MGKHEKQAYLEAMRKRYRKTKRADKGKILDEFCSACNYLRNYAFRLLRREVNRKDFAHSACIIAVDFGGFHGLPGKTAHPVRRARHPL